MSPLRLICILPASIALLVGTAVPDKLTPADKPAAWIEIQTPHFIVAGNDGENSARRVADQFEQIRYLYSKALNRKLRLDPGIPILIFAVKNEKSLSQLIPEYWATKGHIHPAGLFVPGKEKNYIVLRTDVEGEFPYQNIYHEYVHMIVNLNYQHFPLWLNEGFADFLGCATLNAKSGKLGQPSSSELYALQQGKLLPLDILFKVDQRSPYYNEENKTTVFYAESWALVHYLMTDPEKQKEQALSKYISLVENGADHVEAATRAFGDLAQLQKVLQTYIAKTSYLEYTVTLPPRADANNYSVHGISPAEAQARLGDFDLHRGQLEGARKKLEEAIRLDPNLPAPQESMGLLLFRQDERYGAEKYFSRAATLDSKSALTYYYHAMLVLSDGTGPEQMAEAKTALEKAVALNPGLGSAWSNLAIVYLNDPATIEKALIAAKRAVDTMPGEASFQYNLAVVLAQMERFDEARTIARKLQSSGDPSVVSLVNRFLTTADQEQEYAAYKKSNEASSIASQPINGENKSMVESHGPVLKRNMPDAPSTNTEDKTGSTESPSGSRAYSMVGTITNVNCTEAPQIQITLRAQTIAMHLHSEDFSRVAFKFAGANPAAKALNCMALRGRNARVSYQLVTEKHWDGELVSIELRDNP